MSAVDAALKTQRRAFDDEIDKRTLGRLGELKKDAENWLKTRSLLETKPDDYVYQPDVVAAIQMVIKTGVAKSYGGVQSLIETVDRAHKDLSKIAAELKLDGPKKRGTR
jgi:hypothetical protein